MVWACLSLIGVGFAAALPLTWVCRAAAGRLGQLDAPGERKIHDRPIPATGGVAIVLATVGAMGLALAGAWLAPGRWWAAAAGGAVVEHLPGVRAQTPMAVGVLGAMLILHVLGLVDDRRGLGAGVKLAVQVAVAGAVAWGLGIRTLTLLGPVASIGLTAVWIVAMTNAFNMLDNMDGLSGGVAAICGAVLLGCALMGGQWFVAGLLALLVGSLLGFLVFNFPPASIFMGDGGSLVVGFTLAVGSVRLTYVGVEPALGASGAGAHWWAVFTPIVVMAVPLYDLVSVTGIRLAQGRNPLVGDTQHFSHRLVRRGLSRRAAVIVIYACTASTALGGLLLGRVPGWAAAIVVAQVGMVLLTLGLLERARGGGPEA